MKKVCCMLALAAICFGSVYAHGTPATVKNMTAQQDTTKKKVKTKDGKTKTKTKTKTDTTSTPKPSM